LIINEESNRASPSPNEDMKTPTVTFVEPQNPPVSQFIEKDPKFIKFLKDGTNPIPVSGPVPVPAIRTVLWKNVCKIGNECRECIVEMSKTKMKFYIVALDL